MIERIVLSLALALDVARPPLSSGHDLVWHDGFQRVLLLNVAPDSPPSAGETIPIWKWSGERWEPLATTGGPERRAAFAVAYDAKRDRLVIHGGATVATREPLEIRHHGDTWEWNAHENEWRRFDETPDGPGKRSHHAMAYDAARGVTVLFGGQDASEAPLADTWEWDGASWTRRGEDGPRVPGRARLVWDAGRERVLLFGGGRGEPWAWDGTAWRALGGSGHPVPRGGAAVAYDPAGKRTVVFGGRAKDAFFRDAWVFTGAGWTRLPQDMPSARAGSAMAFDAKRGKLVVFGGADDEGELGDTWEIGAPRLVAVDAGPGLQDGVARPPLRTHFPAAFDAGLGKVVVAGGSAPVRPGETFIDDAWTWDGKRWEKLAEKTGDFSNSHRLVFDPKGKRLLAFGGFHTAGERDGRALGSMRVLERGKWKPIDDAPERAMAEGGVVWDAARGRLVAYGGAIEGDAATWEWDGAMWEKRAIESPPRRDAFTMAYDAGRKVAVLHGGTSRDRGPLDETWEYDGAKWTRVAERSPLGARDGALSTYDAKRKRLVLFGGESSEPGGRRTTHRDTWTWDGASWSRLAEDGPPNVTGSDGAMTYDARRERVVLVVSRYQRRLDRPVEVWEWDGAKWERADPR